MNTSVRARYASRGFSFVELLVTIVIAGIIFMAMVPMFVNATKKNSSDSARLQAANVAQDKIEKIRQLAYGSIEASSSLPNVTPNLYNTEFADRQFGPETTLTTGTGIRKIYTDYQVTAYPAVNTGLASQYKVVTVTAYWKGPPAPVKRVVLQTIIYRQYAGPPITDFSLTPGIEDDGVLGVFGSARDNLASVTLSAHVDLSSGVTPASVQFKIAALGGQTIASKLVKTTDGSSWYDGNGTFSWTWDCSTAANTDYDMQATAFSTDGFAGNTPHLYPRIDHFLPPAPPSAVTAVPGNNAVSLSWGLSPVPAAELASYEVFRATSAGTWTTPPTTVVIQPATTFTDTGLVNGTTYYYGVRAVTRDNRLSAIVVSNAVKPALSSDITPPTAPSPVAATAAPAAGTITLSWGAATDPGSPSTGILQYEVWRSDNEVSWGASPLKVLPGLSYADATAGWNKKWYYQIRAVDRTLLVGPWSAMVNATTVMQQSHYLEISLITKKSVACTVWVLAADNRHYYDMSGIDRGTNPPAGTAIAAAGSVTFSNLPDGAYTVFCDWITGGSKTYGATVQAPFGTLSGVGP